MHVTGIQRQKLQHLCIYLVLLSANLSGQTFDQAKSLYYKGVDGDKTATRESTAILSKLAAQKPGDPLIAAYLASNKLLESSRTFALWNKNRLAKEGTLGLDRAVGMAPDNLEVRFIRAASTWNLPGFFKRQEQSEADFAYLAPRVAEAAVKGTLEKRLADAALHYYGQILHHQKR
ncbi:MAG: hypothetical protein SGI92_21855 [Bryobacteraceae bacterium]|nr:hypothetical protein [Bryobacteraceae bacterium]